MDNITRSTKVRSCCVPGCTDRKSIRHRFPLNDPERFEIWRRNVGNPKIKDMTMERIYSTRLVCSWHFVPKFIVPGSKRLHRRAIPTENLPFSISEDNNDKDDEVEEIIYLTIHNDEEDTEVFTSIPDEFPPEDESSKTDDPTVTNNAKENTEDCILIDLPENSEVAAPIEIPIETPAATSTNTTSTFVYSCVVPGCQPEDKIRLEFPSIRMDKERFKVWLKIINDPELESLPPEEIASNYRICRRHFETNCLKSFNRLRMDAIPTLFVADPEAGKKWQYQNKLKDKIRTCIDNDNNVLSASKPDASKVSDLVAEKPMENRCRICLKQSENTLPLSYSTYIDGEGSQTICELINKCFKLQLLIVDNKPKTICVDCAQTARSAYEFKKCCESSEVALQKEVDPEVDPTTIICYMDVEEFEKIQDMCVNKPEDPLKITAPPHKPNISTPHQPKTISLYQPKITSSHQQKIITPHHPNIIKPAVIKKSQYVINQQYVRKKKLVNVGVNTVSNVLNKISVSSLKKNMKIVNIIKKCDKSVGVDFKCGCSRKSKKRSTVCVQCRKTFHANLRFKSYTSVFIARKKFKCIDCRARFACPRNLNLHLLAHLRSNDKPKLKEDEEYEDGSSLSMLG